MTTLFDRGAPGPATHALVVGVGSYQYVDDETRPVVRALQLGQLTSPPVSATRFTDWLIAEHRNPTAMLASVELLLSAPSRRYRSPDGQFDTEVEPATMANFRAAWDKWFDRCNQDAGNVAIFYFCGHGILKTHQSLLLEDFGESENRLFDNAVDIDENHTAMRSICQARVQCFFVDACRQVPYEMLARLNVGGRVLLDGQIGRCLAEDAPIFYATAPTYAAYGQRNSPTVFTQALLLSLRGAGSKLARGRWVVSLGRLQEGIVEAMKRLERANLLPPQKPLLGPSESSLMSVIHELEVPPPVPVVIELEPTAAAVKAELFVTAVSNPTVHHDRQFAEGDWELELTAGEAYDGGARFPGGEYRDYLCRLPTPMPPVLELPWTVG